MRRATEADPIGREYYQRLIAAARTETKIKITVQRPRDDVSLRDAIEANKFGVIGTAWNCPTVFR